MTASQRADGQGDARPVISLHLDAAGQDEGEIRLDDLTKIAEATQTVIRRIARGMVGQSRIGRASKPVTEATTLSLIRLGKGSTVLEIAGPPPMDDQDAFEFDLPTDLSELSLKLLSEGVCALASDDDVPELPAGFDSSLVRDFDAWLKSLRKFDSVGVDSAIGGKELHAQVVPQVARRRLSEATPQPVLPFVSPTEQALRGRLYALNLITGTFSIEDDAGHKIRLKVPQDVRQTAALLVAQHVKAIGKPELDDLGRLRSFTVTSLELAPDIDALAQQTEFFEPHELRRPAPGDLRTLDEWSIEGLTEEEADGFLSALAEL